MRKIFYGWRIVIAGGALQFLQSLLLNQAFGVYVAVLVEDRGWSKTAVSGAAALKSTEVAHARPGARLGGRPLRLAGHRPRRHRHLRHRFHAALSQIETLAGFYAAFVVVALGSSMFSNFVVSVAIIQWFEKRRARALSALQFGGAIGGLFVFLDRLVDTGLRLAGDRLRLGRHRDPGRLAAGAGDPQPPGGSR